MPITDHISYKSNEGILRQRASIVCKKIHKNKSDMYKYAMNKLYQEIQLREEESGVESGKEIVFC